MHSPQVHLNPFGLREFFLFLEAASDVGGGEGDLEVALGGMAGAAMLTGGGVGGLAAPLAWGGGDLAFDFAAGGEVFDDGRVDDVDFCDEAVESSVSSDDDSMMRRWCIGDGIAGASSTNFPDTKLKGAHSPLCKISAFSPDASHFTDFGAVVFEKKIEAAAHSAMVV